MRTFSGEVSPAQIARVVRDHELFRDHILETEWYLKPSHRLGGLTPDEIASVKHGFYLMLTDLRPVAWFDPFALNGSGTHGAWVIPLLAANDRAEDILLAGVTIPEGIVTL